MRKIMLSIRYMCNFPVNDFDFLNLICYVFSVTDATILFKILPVIWQKCFKQKVINVQLSINYKTKDWTNVFLSYIIECIINSISSTITHKKSYMVSFKKMKLTYLQNNIFVSFLFIISSKSGTFCLSIFRHSIESAWKIMTIVTLNTKHIVRSLWHSNVKSKLFNRIHKRIGRNTKQETFQFVDWQCNNIKHVI